MDLTQRKLTKNEWETIEIPISGDEKKILQMITHGYNNVQVSHNDNISLLTYTKIVKSDAIETYMFKKYFKPIIDKQTNKFKISIQIDTDVSQPIKKADIIRIENTDKTLQTIKDSIFDFILLKLIEALLKHSNDDTKYYYYYTLVNIINYQITDINKYVMNYVKQVLESFSNKVEISDIITNASRCIERNSYLLKYKDITLYDHQKQLFTICKNPDPKLVLYIAPTGTGKTMSPIGLSEKHKIIFMCAARHVGLALAKASISLGKKIAIAFGCNAVEDIRLHYYAAKEYSVHRKSGGIFKVDNSVGDNVEIMICDMKSYQHAMNYMNAFNKVEDIILYWDEPTITMDYNSHPIHDIITDNWSKNIIPNIILSSATLPKEHEILPVITDFKCKFHNGFSTSIISNDCIKSISLINKEGFIELPHYLFENYTKLKQSVRHCKNYTTLLRYFDLQEVIDFIIYVNKNKYYSKSRYSINSQFAEITDITMNNIKMYYLELLDNIKTTAWSTIFKHFNNIREKAYDSTIYVATKDAHTLTDGPAIFLANDVEKIAKFCLQSIKIPANVTDGIKHVIAYNNIVNRKISDLEKELEDNISKNNDKDKIDSVPKISNEARALMEKIDDQRALIKIVALHDLFIPNRKSHIDKWAPGINKKHTETSYTSSVSEKYVEEIMQLPDIDDMWKILLLMGIGAFTNHKSIAYNEIMKKLAENQNLYLIIASTDYIYGTNYQFCHSYICKDLSDMTQEKCIQAMGRVGRNKIQQHYTIRLRDDVFVQKLFMEEQHKPEIINMNKLLNSGAEIADAMGF